jgi:hypothetical protein
MSARCPKQVTGTSQFGQYARSRPGSCVSLLNDDTTWFRQSLETLIEELAYPGEVRAPEAVESLADRSGRSSLRKTDRTGESLGRREQEQKNGNWVTKYISPGDLP